MGGAIAQSVWQRRGEFGASIKARIKAQILRHFFSYDAARLVARLRMLGVVSGDALMVHASWLPMNGFLGRPADMIAALQTAVGQAGLLVMPSLTYQNQSSREFLLSGRPMDVRRSASKMGLLSETFRRSTDVVRSLSPTHPLLAWGRESAAFLADHERALVPFGQGSPFAKLLERRGKILT